jgi:FMN phosphatase YigB (HAD superfamily)
MMAVVFDLFGTIVSSAAPRWCELPLTVPASRPVPKDEVLPHLRALREGLECAVSPDSLQQRPAQEVIDGLLSSVQDCEIRTAVKWVVEVHLRQGLDELFCQPLVGVRDTLRRLRDDDVAVALLSNTTAPPHVLRYALHRHGLLAYFTAVSFSSETGVLKPSTAAFEDVATRLRRARPGIETFVMVGDRFEDDIAPSRRQGWTAIYVSGPEQPEAAGRADERKLASRVDHALANAGRPCTADGVRGGVDCCER